MVIYSKESSFKSGFFQNLAQTEMMDLCSWLGWEFATFMNFLNQNRWIVDGVLDNTSFEEYWGETDALEFNQITFKNMQLKTLFLGFDNQLLNLAKTSPDMNDIDFDKFVFWRETGKYFEPGTGEDKESTTMMNRRVGLLKYTHSKLEIIRQSNYTDLNKTTEGRQRLDELRSIEDIVRYNMMNPIMEHNLGGRVV